MIRISQIVAVAGMAAMLSLAACATDDVSASADGQGTLSTEAELTCCQEAAMAGKTECCGQDIEGKYCPVTGQKVEE